MSKNVIKKKIDYAKVQDALDFAEKLIRREGAAAEKFLITFHVVKEGRIFHHFSYEDFPSDDWGKCIIATSVEARRAALIAQTGASKI